MKGGKVACAAGEKDLNCPVGGTAHRDPEPEKQKSPIRAKTMESATILVSIPAGLINAAFSQESERSVDTINKYPILSIIK
jgi:hypothetical protein